MMSQRKIIFGSIASLIILFSAMYVIRPDWVIGIKEWAFVDSDETKENSRLEGFSELKDKVIVKKDIEYSKEYENSQLDVYLPKENFGTPKPTIFWAHGGAFIAGDKKSVADYSVMLASQGYVVVNMNYSLAPKYEYPTPIIQIGEAYLYMASHQKKYDMDIRKVAFGGDSAGGQIIGQFVNVQVNEYYAQELGIQPVVRAETIRAVIFFSALLDLSKYDENESDFANHVLDKSAQAYFGVKQWKYSDKAKEANIVGNVNGDFPPTYLTDGNTNSFQAQAEELAGQLKQHHVPVETTFFSRKQAELLHEYQFKMGLKEAQENYKKVTAFLNKYVKGI